jgi:hypothetical protein
MGRRVVLWAPRVAGLGLALFLAAMGLDALVNDRGILAAAVAFAMGLVPALVVLVAVIIGWRHPAWAGFIFAGLAAFYTATTIDRPQWVITIAGPLAVIAVLFFMSWKLQAANQPRT